jgi:hemerythrin-like metal-binding protein
MTPEQTRLLAESFSKLESRLYDLASLVHQRLFEISPESRSLFKGDLEEQKVKMARVFAEFVRLQTRSRHFLPVTGNGGEIVIPGIGALGARHEIAYGVRPRHYGYMREALLYAIRQMLGRDYNDTTGRAWAETFDMLAGAMQKHAGDNPGAVAFAKLFYRKGTEAAPLITWSDTLSVGIEQIDNEHKRLLVLLNELNRALDAGVGQGALGGVLEGLVHYASYHFTHEEDLFRRSDYPGYEAHLRQHQILTAKAVEVYTNFQSGEAEVLPSEVLDFLKNWLYHHIMGSDRDFGAYLKANPRALRPE